jgi:hypothetical protein
MLGNIRLWEKFLEEFFIPGIITITHHSQLSAICSKRFSFFFLVRCVVWIHLPLVRRNPPHELSFLVVRHHVKFIDNNQPWIVAHFAEQVIEFICKSIPYQNIAAAVNPICIQSLLFVYLHVLLD